VSISDDASVRLLPWQTSDGKPAYLVTDASGASPLAQLADRVEGELIGNAEHVLTMCQRSEVETATADELRFVVGQLCASLADLLRIAESRGMRL
jgi:hypothetical protein